MHVQIPIEISGKSDMIQCTIVSKKRTKEVSHAPDGKLSVSFNLQIGLHVESSRISLAFYSISLYLTLHSADYH